MINLIKSHNEKLCKYINYLESAIPQYLYWAVFLSLPVVMLEKYVPFNFLGIFMVLVIVMNLILNYKSKNNIYNLILIGIVFLQFVFNHKWNTNYNSIVRLIFTCAMFQLITNKNIVNGFKDFTLKNIKYLYIIMNACMFLLVVSAIAGFGFEKWWGNEKYFIGTFDNPHLCGYFLMSMLAVVTIIRMYSGKWYLYIYEVIILVLSFMTGARTPLIIIALLGIMNFIFDIKNRIKYWKINLGLILSSVVIFVLTGLFKHLPLIEKTIRTSTAGGFTSGRNVFWRYLIDYYVNKFTIFEKLFGSGMDITVFINETYYKMAIWAHNDFIQVLLSYGLIGVLLYIVILLKSIKTINLWILSGFIFLAVFNGLFNYHLFIFTLPFFTVIKILYSEKYKEVKE